MGLPACIRTWAWLPAPWQGGGWRATTHTKKCLFFAIKTTIKTQFKKLDNLKKCSAKHTRPSLNKGCLLSAWPWTLRSHSGAYLACTSTVEKEVHRRRCTSSGGSQRRGRGRERTSGVSLSPLPKKAQPADLLPFTNKVDQNFRAILNGSPLVIVTELA